MTLHETQTLFADAMLNRSGLPDSSLAALFMGDERAFPERLKIYRNNIVGGLSDVLLSTYPIIEKIGGHDFSKVLMRAFVLENPPRESCLARYGEGLDKFIEKFPSAQGLSYLPDIARLEWAMNEAYYAPDDGPLTAAALAKISPCHLADLVFPLRNSVRLVQSRWPLLAIRDFCMKENRPETETLNLDQGGCRVMVYRPDLTTEIIPLKPDEYALLAPIADGRTLGNAVELALGSFPDFSLQDFLKEYLPLEIFSTFTQDV